MTTSTSSFEIILGDCIEVMAKLPEHIKDRSAPDYIAEKWMAVHNSVNDHPAEKPRALLQKLLTLACPRRGGVVLDPFCGSAASGYDWATKAKKALHRHNRALMARES